MKYTDRKGAPLKWHRVVEFLILPLSIIYAGYVVLSLTSELFHLGLVLPRFLTSFLIGTGASLSNLKNMFWPVMFIYAWCLFILIFLIWIWTGFLRWHNSARIGWIVYRLIRTIENGIILAGLFLVFFGSEYLRFLLMAMTSYLSTAILEILLILLLVWNIVYFILNLVYYHKRKPLFAAYYAGPAEEEPDLVPGGEPEGNTDKTDSQTEPLKPVEETSASKPEPSSPENPEAVPELETKEEVSDLHETAASEESPESSEDSSINESESSETELPEEKTETSKESAEAPSEESSSETDQPETEESEETSESDEQTEAVSVPASSESEETLSEPQKEESASASSGNEISEEPSETEEPALESEETAELTKEETEPVETAEPDEILFCPNCGAKLGEADHLFCTHCGAKLR